MLIIKQQHFIVWTQNRWHFSKYLLWNISCACFVSLQVITQQADVNVFFCLCYGNVFLGGLNMLSCVQTAAVKVNRHQRDWPEGDGVRDYERPPSTQNHPCISFSVDSLFIHDEVYFCHKIFLKVHSEWTC